MDLQTAARLLADGQPVTFRPRGNSMAGRIENGALVTLEPAAARAPRADDAVLVRVGDRLCLHLVREIDGDRYQIASNQGCIDGWADRGSIFGVVVRVEP